MSAGTRTNVFFRLARQQPSPHQAGVAPTKGATFTALEPDNEIVVSKPTNSTTPATVAFPVLAPNSTVPNNTGDVECVTCAAVFDARSGSDDTDRPISDQMLHEIGRPMARRAVVHDENSICACNGPMSTGRHFSLFDPQLGLASRTVEELLMREIPEQIEKIDAFHRHSSRFGDELPNNNTSSNSEFQDFAAGTTFLVFASCVAIDGGRGGNADLLHGFGRPPPPVADSYNNNIFHDHGSNQLRLRDQPLFDGFSFGGATRLRVETPEQFRGMLQYANQRQEEARRNTAMRINSRMATAHRVLYIEVVKLQPGSNTASSLSLRRTHEGDPAITVSRLTFAILPDTDAPRKYASRRTCPPDTDPDSLQQRIDITYEERAVLSVIDCANSAVGVATGRTRFIPVRNSHFTMVTKELFQSTANSFVIMSLRTEASRLALEDNRGVLRMSSLWLQIPCRPRKRPAAPMWDFVDWTEKLASVWKKHEDEVEGSKGNERFQRILPWDRDEFMMMMMVVEDCKLTGCCLDRTPPPPPSIEKKEDDHG